MSTALLGTRRREPEFGGLPRGVRALAGARADSAESVLAAAAAMTAYRRAGWTTAGEADPLEAADPDHRADLPVVARERLARLLGANRPELLEEWLGVVAARGLRVPPERLPALAEAARSRANLRGPVALVAGPAGRWLAAINPDWRFLTAAAPEAAAATDAWRFGTPAQRRTWLAVALTADPAGARAAVTATWSGEPAEVRATVLELLGEHLEPEDEPFLEAALGDRAASVRQQAAALLARIPGSALGRRMAERLRPLIEVRTRSGGGPSGGGDVLVVSLPAGEDAAAARDGVSGSGTRRLRQLVAATPPGFWAGFGTPGQLLRMGVEGCPAPVLWESWAIAAIRHRDEQWALALFEADPTRAGAGGLFEVLPAQRRARIFGRLSRQSPPETVSKLVLDLPAPWPRELGVVLLDWLSAQDDHRAVSHAAVTIARTVPPSCLGHPLVTTALPAGSAPWRRALAETLNFRREMYEELS